MTHADHAPDALEALELRNAPDAQRYEAVLDGEVVGLAEYRASHDVLLFTHTEVDPALEGRGVGQRLVRFALDDTRARGLKAAPLCPFVSAFIRRHPDYLDLVPEEHRRALGV
jgi:predicted GNAT family acetyltransferase